MLTENFEHCDNTALLKSLLVAVQRLRHTGFALSVIASDATFPRGRGFAFPLRFKALPLGELSSKARLRGQGR